MGSACGWDSVCLCHVYFICIDCTSHADSRKSSDSDARCCRCRHILFLRRRAGGLDHLSAARDPATRMHKGNTFTLSHTLDKQFALPPSAPAVRDGLYSTPIGQ